MPLCAFGESEEMTILVRRQLRHESPNRGWSHASVGKGDKNAADDAAVEAMRDVLKTIQMVTLPTQPRRAACSPTSTSSADPDASENFPCPPQDGVIVIGEGEKDQAPMLFRGEKLGDGSNPCVDVAVRPKPRGGSTRTLISYPSATGLPAGAAAFPQRRRVLTCCCALTCSVRPPRRWTP